MEKQRKELILYCMQPFINIRKRKIDLSAHPPIITGNRNKKQQQYECDFCMLPLHFACLLLMAITYAVVVPRSVNSVGLISVAVNNVMLLLHCIYHTKHCLVLPRRLCLLVKKKASSRRGRENAMWCMRK